MAKSMKLNDYLIGAAIGIGAYFIADSMGLINQVKNAIMPQSRVSYYHARPAYNAGIGQTYGQQEMSQRAKAYIGEAYGLGQQSQSGDYNSIPMFE
jgi:hypothetical protein